MSRTDRFETFLFWLMILLGSAALAPCLILPAWLEYQAQLDRRHAALAERDRPRQHLHAVQKQIEHLRSDPAYVMRIGQEEFGPSARLPDVETVRVEATHDQSTTPTDETALTADQEELLPELSAFVERALERYPYTRLFVHSRTRPALMAMGGTLILAAVVLLGMPSRRRTRRAPAPRHK